MYQSYLTLLTVWIMRERLQYRERANLAHFRGHRTASLVCDTSDKPYLIQYHQLGHRHASAQVVAPRVLVSTIELRVP